MGWRLLNDKERAPWPALEILKDREGGRVPEYLLYYPSGRAVWLR